MDSPSVFLSYPVMIAPEMTSFMSMQKAIATCGYPVMFQLEVGDSFITRVRNNHVSRFLAGDWTHYVTWDSDLVFYPTAGCANPIKKLVENNLEFCGALYACKDAKIRRVASNRGKYGDSPIVPICHESGHHKFRWLGGGMWCVRRDAIVRMAEHYPELEYGGTNGEDFTIHGLFNPFICENILLSEDWSFCERFLNTPGCGVPFADTSIVLGHVGKREFFVWGEPVDAII